MKILNNAKGNIDGKVILTQMDCNLINTALFYRQKAEPNQEIRDYIENLRLQFEAMVDEHDADRAGGDWSELI